MALLHCKRRAISGDEQSRTEDVCWPNGTVIPRNREERPKTSGKVLFVGSLNYGPTSQDYDGTWNMFIACSMSFQTIHSPLLEEIPIQRLLKSSDYPRVDVIPDAPDLSKLYFTHHASVVPLLHGSGSRLKIPGPSFMIVQS